MEKIKRNIIFIVLPGWIHMRWQKLIFLLDFIEMNTVPVSYKK